VEDNAYPDQREQPAIARRRFSLQRPLKGIDDIANQGVVVHSLVGLLDPEKNPHALSMHRTTVTSMIPHADRKQLDEKLVEQYKECVEELDGFGAKSKALIMVADDTHEKVRSMYYKNNYSYVVVGQTSTWQRGFVYPTEYDATHQLFMGSQHHDYRLIDSEKKGLRPWLLDVKAKTKMARELGIEQVLIEGDRAYFNAEILSNKEGASRRPPLPETRRASFPAPGLRPGRLASRHRVPRVTVHHDHLLGIANPSMNLSTQLSNTLKACPRLRSVGFPTA
jgi:hypothetical protein